MHPILLIFGIALALFLLTFMVSETTPVPPPPVDKKAEIAKISAEVQDRNFKERALEVIRENMYIPTWNPPGTPRFQFDSLNKFDF